MRARTTNVQPFVVFGAALNTNAERNLLSCIRDSKLDPITDLANFETIMLSLASLRVNAPLAWAIVSTPVNKMYSLWQQAPPSYLSQRLELDNDKRIVCR